MDSRILRQKKLLTELLARVDDLLLQTDGLLTPKKQVALEETSRSNIAEVGASSSPL